MCPAPRLTLPGHWRYQVLSPLPYQPMRGAAPALFWRHCKDNRYAVYDGEAKPAIRECDEDGRQRAVIRVPADGVPIRADIGRDLSHAPRLVHYLKGLTQSTDPQDWAFIERYYPGLSDTRPNPMCAWCSN